MASGNDHRTDPHIRDDSRIPPQKTIIILESIKATHRQQRDHHVYVMMMMTTMMPAIFSDQTSKLLTRPGMARIAKQHNDNM